MALRAIVRHLIGEDYEIPYTVGRIANYSPRRMR